MLNILGKSKFGLVIILSLLVFITFGCAKPVPAPAPASPPAPAPAPAPFPGPAPTPSPAPSPAPAPAPSPQPTPISPLPPTPLPIPTWPYELVSPKLLAELGIANFDAEATQLVNQTVEDLSNLWGFQASEETIRIMHEYLYLSAAEVSVAQLAPQTDLSKEMPLIVGYEDAAQAIMVFDTISGGCDPPLKKELLDPTRVFVFAGDVGKFLDSKQSIDSLQDAPLDVAMDMYFPTAKVDLPELVSLSIPYRAFIWDTKLELAEGNKKEDIVKDYNEYFVPKLET